MVDQYCRRFLFCVPFYLQHSPYKTAGSKSAGQEIPYLLWNPKVNYHVYRILALVPVYMYFLVPTYL